MAKHGNKGGQSAQQKKLEETPFVVYEAQPLVKQLACYYFWLYLDTGGKSGWNPNQTPGSRWNWREFEFIRSNILVGSWPSVGQVRPIDNDLICCLQGIDNDCDNDCCLCFALTAATPSSLENGNTCQTS